MSIYRSILFSACLGSLTLLAQAQTAITAPFDSTYRPPIYAGKVGQFKSFPKSTRDIVFLGNSIMTYTDWNELLGLITAKNRGIPGDITYGVLDRLQDVIDGHPAKIFILIGINDITRNAPEDAIVSNYKKIISRIKSGSPATRIYFHTLLPVNDTYVPMIGKTNHVISVNAKLKTLIEKEAVTLIDLYPYFLGPDSKLDPKYTFDGIHLNQLGYFKWAEILKKGNYLK